MKFKANIIGNRIAIKTIKKENELSKVTYLTFDKAKTVINNIIKNGWTIDLDNNVKYIL